MSFLPITDAELAADKPLTTGLLKKFRDNVLGHDHSTGQGGPLVADSLGDRAASEANLTLSSFGTTVLKPTMTVFENTRSKSFLGFFSAANKDKLFFDAEDSLAFTPTFNGQWIIDFVFDIDAGAPSAANLHVELILFRDGVEVVDKKIKHNVANGENQSPAPWSLVHYETGLTGVEHTYKVALRNVNNTFTGGGIITIDKRTVMLREWRA